MKLTIFFRMVIGYLAIFLLVIAMSAYAVVRIGQFNDVTHSVLMTNNRIIDRTTKLTDSLLSQIRYEKKFLITRDQVFYRQFSKFKSDFDQYLDEIISLADSSETVSMLNRVRDAYQTYQTLFSEEVTYLKDGKEYSQPSYRQKKDRVSNEIIEQLEKLRISIQENTTEKIRRLYEAGTEARRMAILMTGGFLLLGVAISFFIHRSITQPISVLKRKTREIAKGEFKGDLHLSSPPEFAELTGAFNLMCNRLNELDQMKSDFFSSVAHEVRNPLSSIKMAIGLLLGGREGPVTSGQNELLVLLDGEINRLIKLINTLLDLAKMEAGMVTYGFEPREMAPLIHQVINEMKPLVEGKAIGLESEIIEGLPIVKIDRERMLQVLRNIIGNAIKFTPEEGHVKVCARPDNGGVRVSVTDTGPGIAAESLNSIFEKFRQATHEGSNQSKGTGLGLAIAKQIVMHHGGRIWVESEPGHGSTFIFVLPA